MFVRSKTLKIVSIFVLFALATAARSACQQGVIDVNHCGMYPPACTLINYSDQVLGCCAPGSRQAVRKEWYDCTGGGTASCEYDLWFTLGDPTCP